MPAWFEEGESSGLVWFGFSCKYDFCFCSPFVDFGDGLSTLYSRVGGCKRVKRAEIT